MDKLTSDLLVSLSGLVLSLACWYVPALRRWLETMGDYKPMFMALTLLLVTVVYTAVWCHLALECMKLNIGAALLVWLGALGANQGAYLAVVKPAKKAAEEATIVDMMSRR